MFKQTDKNSSCTFGDVVYVCVALNSYLQLLFIDIEDGDSDVEQSAIDSKYELGYKRVARTAVLIKEFIPIDKHHPVVKELLDMDYELERCLEAAERFPDDVTQAQEYLMDTGETGELFASSVQTGGYEAYCDDGNLRPSDTLLTVDVQEGVLQPNASAFELTLDGYVLI